METVFSSIINGNEGYVVWEDDSHIAFLTPYPNTPGVTIVIPKKNITDYIFDLNQDDYISLMIATQKVARMLEVALDVPRVALVFEGTGVPHVHAKLYPLYGKQASETDVWSDHTEYTEVYRKYITTVEGPKMSDEELKAIQKKIIGAKQD